MMVPRISVEVKYIPSSDPCLPSLALQVTKLVDSYMLWVGTIEDNTGEDVEQAPLQGSLCRDWAFAMPPMKVCTTCYRTDINIYIFRTFRQE